MSKKYYYEIHIHECPVCGSSKVYREILTTPMVLYVSPMRPRARFRRTTRSK